MEIGDFLKWRRGVRPQAESEKEGKTAGLAESGLIQEPCKGFGYYLEVNYWHNLLEFKIF